MGEGGALSGEVYTTYSGIAGARNWRDKEGLKSHFDKSVYFPANPGMIEAPVEGEENVEVVTVTSGINMSGKYAKNGVRSDVSGEITANELNLDFLLVERQKELASELTRRTDLIRFGKYTKGNNWDWKNGVRLGADVDDKYNLFPIPESELTNNPTLVQNDGYKVIK